MVGLDVVDLQRVSTSVPATDELFLEKIFSPAERGLLDAYPLTDSLVWTGWSVKEAAYKASQYFGIWQRFTPLYFRIESLVGYRHNVHAVCNGMACTSWISDGAIWSVASVTAVPLHEILLGEYEEEEAIITRIQEHYRDRRPFRIVRRTSGMPVLEPGEGIFHMSLSHHGRKKAFAVLKCR